MRVSLTPKAKEQLRSVIDREGKPGVGLRVFVTPGGCSGFSYGMQLDDDPAEDDNVFELEGLQVVVDAFSSQYLEGAQIDYVDSLMGGGFTVQNPNAVKNCACGQSFDTAEAVGHAKPCH